MSLPRLPLTILLLAALALAGCTSDDGSGGNGTTTTSSGGGDGGDGDGGLVENDCTEHPEYGTGNPHVTLNTTMGNITAEIFVDKVPNTGMNFVKLVEAGTLDGSPFHRIITNFMMQGGDFDNKNGTGGKAHPDCDTGDGDIVDEYHPELKHTGKGVFSMANAGPNSASSQFFITFTATPWLDGYDESGKMKPCGQRDAAGRPVSCHAVFGQVTEGMEILDKVNQEAGSSTGTPKVPVTLVKAIVSWD